MGATSTHPGVRTRQAELVERSEVSVTRWGETSLKVIQFLAGFEDHRV
jgi:hypothetical protein